MTTSLTTLTAAAFADAMASLASKGLIKLHGGSVMLMAT